jgi:hypothetical protein
MMDMTMKLNEIQDRYTERAIQFGSQFLLKPKDAIEYLNDCVANGFKLDGVEGFLITEAGAYQPSQDDSNDIVDNNCTREEFTELTKSFMADRSEIEILFEVIFTEEGKY